MQTHSAEMRDAAPFIADHMTVCSERHRQFWVRAGAPGAADRGHRPAAVRPVRGAAAHRSRRAVDGCCSSATSSTPTSPAWGTEWVCAPGLRCAMPRRRCWSPRASRGRCEVIVKCHPQQDHRAEVEPAAGAGVQAWNRAFRGPGRRRHARAHPGKRRRGRLPDDRAVRGRGGRPTDGVRGMGRRVPARPRPAHPFRRRAADSACGTPPPPPSWPGCSVVRRLRSISGCERWYEEALGPVDGRATDRVATRLAAVAAAWPAGHARRDLEGRGAVSRWPSWCGPRSRRRCGQRPARLPGPPDSSAECWRGAVSPRGASDGRSPRCVAVSGRRQPWWRLKGPPR